VAPAVVDATGAPCFPGGYKVYIALHERAPGIGPLAGWRGEGRAGHSHNSNLSRTSQLAVL